MNCPCNTAGCDGSGGHVYFVGTTWHIKIGYTTRPLKRIRQLRAGCPLVLETLALMPGTKDDERRLHEKFAHLRFSHEWFRRPDDRTGEIDQFLQSHEMIGWVWFDDLGFEEAA